MIRCIIVANGDTIWFLFQIISAFLMNIKVFYEIYISNYNVFQLPFNRKDVYVANSSPLFETLNAIYSSAFKTWSR